MTNKHTPGPWSVFATHPDGEYKNRVDVGPEDGFEPFGGCGCCGSPWMEGEDEEERIANARLIAAAPDMLEALQGFCRRVEGGEVRSIKTYEKFKAVIAKATGE